MKFYHSLWQSVHAQCTFSSHSPPLFFYFLFLLFKTRDSNCNNWLLVEVSTGITEAAIGLLATNPFLNKMLNLFVRLSLSVSIPFPTISHVCSTISTRHLSTWLHNWSQSEPLLLKSDLSFNTWNVNIHFPVKPPLVNTKLASFIIKFQFLVYSKPTCWRPNNIKNFLWSVLF